MAIPGEDQPAQQDAEHDVQQQQGNAPHITQWAQQVSVRGRNGFNTHQYIILTSFAPS
jgi:hypothetical protein